MHHFKTTTTYATILFLINLLDNAKGQDPCAPGGIGNSFCYDAETCASLFGFITRPSPQCPNQVCCSPSDVIVGPTTTPNPFFTTQNPFQTSANPFLTTLNPTNPFATTPAVISDGQVSPIGGRCGRLGNPDNGGFGLNNGFAFGFASSSSGSGFSDMPGLRIDTDPKDEGNKVVSMRGDERSSRKNSRVKRIVGGDFVPSNDLCYQVAILQGNNLIATGALISNDYVITTYSPLFSLPGSNANGRNLRIVLGGPNLLTSFLQANTGDVFNVTQIIPLPGFVQRTSLGYPVNDMALLKFARNNVVLDTSRICAICLPPRPLSHDDCRRVFVSGYGSIREGVTTSDNRLRRVGVTLIPNAVCDNLFRAVFRNPNYRMDVNSLCAGGEPGRDTCSKDGGAPLICEVANGGLAGSRYLIGLSSWGYGCGRAGYPGVYTNTSSSTVTNFIRSTDSITV